VTRSHDVPTAVLTRAGGDHPRPAGGALTLVGLKKSFGDVHAVRGVDIDIAAGEFFSLLGPSGCGKTTALRLIAGFEAPTEGQILLDGVDQALRPPERRPINTVFQNYALFPFKNVRDNVAFGLRYLDLTKAETRTRIDEALALVRMTEFGARRPSQLSGGQQQRVALARALVLNPRVLLLDEPLGALDAKLRKALQIELKALQETVGITFVYVTHDQEEALTMSDRMAVMARGRVEQVGTPAEVYAEPATAYVADFLGAANVWDADVVDRGAGGVTARLCGRTFEVTAVPGTTVADPSQQAKLVARPERLSLDPVAADHECAGSNRIDGVVARTMYLGSAVSVVVQLAEDCAAMVTRPSDSPDAGLRPGDAVCLTLPAPALRLLPLGG